MSFAPLAPALLIAGLVAVGVGVPALSPSGLPAANVQQERDAKATPAARAAKEELSVPAESVIGLQLEAPVYIPETGSEGRVFARVIRDLMVGSRVAVPAGSRALGWVSLAASKGKLPERPRLEIAFDVLELPGGERVEIATEPIVREARVQDPDAGRPPGTTAGGAVAGAILAGGRSPSFDRALGPSAPPAASTDGPGDLPAGTVLNVRAKPGFRVKIGG